MGVLTDYSVLLAITAGVAGLMLVQLLTADVAGLLGKHVPGTAVPQDHNSFLFRASRALANTNESVAIYVLLVVVLVLAGADADKSGYAAATYLGGRLLHSLCYWFDLRIARSVAFVIALIGLLWMLVVVVQTLAA